MFTLLKKRATKGQFSAKRRNKAKSRWFLNVEAGYIAHLTADGYVIWFEKANNARIRFVRSQSGTWMAEDFASPRYIELLPAEVSDKLRNFDPGKKSKGTVPEPAPEPELVTAFC